MQRIRLAAAAGLLWGLASTLAGAAGLAASTTTAPVPVPDTLAQRLQPCLACHGAQGRSTREGYLPRIAGKPAAYLYQQLRNFRDGRRNNSAMVGFLAHQRDAYLWEMANYFATLDLPLATPPRTSPAPAALLARGETLVRQGDPSRQLPACVVCHGNSLAGTLPAVPGLLGLPQDYLTAQLGAWLTGSRRAVAPDCMAEISRRLAPGDASAVAAWLAAQPVPAHLVADNIPASPPPLPCSRVAEAP